MNRLFILLLIVSIIGNFAGIFFAYKFINLRRQNGRLQKNISESGKMISSLADISERDAIGRIVFLHHSVGKGILEEGQLKDSLEEMGLAIKSLTYGDSIGEYTDMCDWLPKFQNNMNAILHFKQHPNVYYTGGRRNDIVMFKSCFPNSDIDSDGSSPGKPLSKQRTIENYKAVFIGIGKELRKYPGTLFIYMTFPPLVPAETSIENAARARAFNNWLIEVCLPDYYAQSGLNNFAIFDLFGALSDQDNFLRSAYRRSDPHDAHPNNLANHDVTHEFMQFIRPILSKWLKERNVHLQNLDNSE